MPKSRTRKTITKKNVIKSNDVLKLDIGAGKNPKIDKILEGNGNCLRTDNSGNRIELPHQWTSVGEKDFICANCQAKGKRFTTVDILKFDGIDVVMNAGKDKWPFKDNSVDEVHASHFVEHLEAEERIHFVNELYRVLKKPYHENGQLKSGFATVIVPHWASQRAYGDLTHKWPAVSEFWFYYLDKDWRKGNAPHLDYEQVKFGYKCNFSVNWGYNMHPDIQPRNLEYQQNALKFYKEAASDIIAQFVKKD